MVPVEGKFFEGLVVGVFWGVNSVTVADQDEVRPLRVRHWGSGGPVVPFWKAIHLWRSKSLPPDVF